MPSKGGNCPLGPTNTYRVTSPVGDIIYTSCPKGLHSLGIAEEVTDENFSPLPQIEVCLVSQMYEDNSYTYKPATQCLHWLQSYFSPTEKKDALILPKICSHIGKEGSFTYKVWFTLLREVPFGKTVSYRTLAGMCGNMKACRAVGQAMRNNPVGLVIPCHRVIQEGGKLGNYHHGTRNKVKEWLLRHEGSYK
ncbi:hypothetical protein ACF0H5_000458 [Mactra antiquata]